MSQNDERARLRRLRTPLENEIEDLRARGFSATTNDLARDRLEGEAAALDLIPLVETAFAGVKLGKGVGLVQAQGFDDRESQIVCARYREGDEKDDWRLIPIELLNRCYSSLSFFDAEGMRFHLPAFLVAELRGAFDFGIMICLTGANDSEYCREQFALLSTPQRAAVRAVLQHLAVKEARAGGHSSAAIELALADFWLAAKDPVG